MATTVLTVGTGGTYSRIQDAVDAAVNGDTIEIAAGTYREQVTVNGKDITLHGAGSGQTIIERRMRTSSSLMPLTPTRPGRPNTRSSRSRATPTSPSKA